MADIERQGLVDIQMGDDSEEEELEAFRFQDFRHSPEGNSNNLNVSGKSEDDIAPLNLRTQPLEEVNDEDTGDKADLLGGQRKSPPFWTFEYYQQFFDVDTYQVLRRIIGSMVPVYKRNYLVSQIRPNPDLYGPFWVCATLVFTTAIAGNLSSYLDHQGRHEWAYDFHKVTLAAAAIYIYAWLVPTALWGLFMWRRSNAGYSYLEILCAYGYSLSIYIPISILWLIPFEWLRWILVTLGMLLSGAVLLITFWPAVEDDDRKVAGIIMALIFLLHGLLAVGFKLYFFPVHSLHVQPSSAPSLSTTIIPTTPNRTVRSILEHHVEAHHRAMPGSF